MNQVLQVTKETMLKALQQHVTKEREPQQLRTMELKEFQDIDEKLELKAVNAVQIVQDSVDSSRMFAGKKYKAETGGKIPT